MCVATDAAALLPPFSFANADTVATQGTYRQTNIMNEVAAVGEPKTSPMPPNDAITEMTVSFAAMPEISAVTARQFPNPTGANTGEIMRAKVFIILVSPPPVKPCATEKLQSAHIMTLTPSTTDPTREANDSTLRHTTLITRFICGKR